jgi:putative ABC transport system permease protein
MEIVSAENETKLKYSGNLSWLITMAWRDSRRNRSRLLLFISSIILGIAALVAIYALGDNLRQNVDQQAATLLGADLEISGNRPVTPSIQGLIDSLGDKRSQEQSFASMILFTKMGDHAWHKYVHCREIFLIMVNWKLHR